jgi:N utilization substance protein B
MDHEQGRPERTRGREAALQLLYRANVGKLADTAGAESAETLDAYWAEAADYLGGEASYSVRTFAEGLVRGVRAGEADLDALIASALQNWRLERVALIDKLILRIAAFELTRAADPPAVIIDESVELARRFAADDSVRFINGVVDGIRKKLETR